MFTLPVTTADNFTSGWNFAYQHNNFWNLLEVSVIMENGLYSYNRLLNSTTYHCDSIYLLNPLWPFHKNFINN